MKLRIKLILCALSLAAFSSVIPTVSTAQSDGPRRRSGAVGASDLEIWIESKSLVAGASTDTIEVKVDSRGTEISAFDFTFAYDRAGFEIIDALPGTFLDSCGWEYFVVRHSPICPGPCPSGLVKVVALSEYAERKGEACHLPTTESSIIKLVIRTRSHERMEFIDPSLRFFWIDCGDNSVASVSGNDLFLAGSILEPDSIPLPVYGESAFPNYTGPLSECFAGSGINAPSAKLALRNGILHWREPEGFPAASDSLADSAR